MRELPSRCDCGEAFEAGERRVAGIHRCPRCKRDWLVGGRRRSGLMRAAIMFVGFFALVAINAAMAVRRFVLMNKPASRLRLSSENVTVMESDYKLEERGDKVAFVWHARLENPHLKRKGEKVRTRFLLFDAEGRYLAGRWEFTDTGRYIDGVYNVYGVLTVGRETYGRMARSEVRARKIGYYVPHDVADGEDVWRAG